ncbi:purple acid phosphatase [Anaeramoeba flamelloides]|uniref:Purple acid phosphatase n=1 Tax=Anaeramoeba flamelloides TaxID=1746091 RepID=A0AAV7YJV7_9EUKA|nr:purple acid phosphatase [Anaeramoeba flamelloides]KAJ6234827.1 purple acid phosphatase [Anaeramoeba flamelloides]
MMIEDICYDAYDSGFSSSRVTRRYKDSSCESGKPCHVYLTVSEDLRTSIVVVFHTADPYDGKPACKYSQTTDDDYEFEEQGESFEIEFDKERYLHYVGLTGLNPGTGYKFICGEDGETTNWSDEKRFKTTENSTSDDLLTFVVGADTNVVEETNKITAMMASNNPRFAAIGGDIALTNGNLFCYRKWDKWISNWEQYAQHDDYLIPVLPVIGNHEVKEGYRVKDEVDTTKAPFYMTLFQYNSKIEKNPYDQKTYRVSRITHEIAFVSLDTHHVYTEDEQKDWIDETFTELYNDGVQYIFPIYHIPAYPSDKEYSVEKSTRVRTAWTSLFDKHNIRVAFEGHSHMLKMTKPLNDGEIVDQDQGTRFLGDGAWGRLRDRRDVSVKRWYEDFVESKQHAWIVNINGTKFTASAKDDQNEIQADVNY